MSRTSHSARIIGPVTYVANGGRQMKIPLGPCLVEQGDGHTVDIVWGAKGQNSTALPPTAFESAEDSGYLVLLD
ncbi:MAG: hypothetical protein ABI702_07955 [Burkholderiales bacterium]